MLANISKSVSISKALLALVVMSLLFFGSMYFFSKSSFPALAQGQYVGLIRDFPLENGGKKDVSVYLERFPQGNIVMLVLFLDGWTPKSVSLKPLFEDRDQNVVLTKLEPLKFTHDGLDYSMSGYVDSGVIVGKIAFEGSFARKFALAPILDSKLEGLTYDSNVTNVEMSSWVKLKSEYIELRSTLADGEKTKGQKGESLRKLNHFLTNKEQMKSVAEKEKTRLRGELKSLRDNSVAQKTSLKSLVRELEVLGRITERGKTIRLVRRIDNRENKWYLANWREEIDGSSLPNHLRRDPTLNLASLEEDYQSALEVRRLQRVLAKERLAVKYLGDEYQRKLAPIKEALPGDKSEKSFWDRLTE